VTADDPAPIYPHYDRPVLGDYGLAIQTHDADDMNLHWYNNRTVILHFHPG
jgi:hypothetical protein